MASIVLCLLCLAAAALWVVYTTMSGIRSLLTASAEMLVYTVCILLGFAAAYLCFNFIIILFTDISVFWDLIKEFWQSLGGFWGVVGIVIVVGIIIAIGTVGLSILGVVGSILYYVAAAVVGVVCIIFEFIEDKSGYGYNVIVAKIANRLVKRQGGK